MLAESENSCMDAWAVSGSYRDVTRNSSNGAYLSHRHSSDAFCGGFSLAFVAPEP